MSPTPNPSLTGPTQAPTMWGCPAAYYRQHAPAQGLIRRCADELAKELANGRIAAAVELTAPLGPADIAYIIAGLPHAPKGYPAHGDWRGRLADALAAAAGYPAAYAASRHPGPAHAA